MAIVATYQRAFHAGRLHPYPMEALKRGDRPTTVIRDDEIPRLDERQSGFNRALRGDFGPNLSDDTNLEEAIRSSR